MRLLLLDTCIALMAASQQKDQDLTRVLELSTPLPTPQEEREEKETELMTEHTYLINSHKNSKNMGFEQLLG